MKLEHGVEVAALARVVRQMLDEAAGARVGPAAGRAMALVERWLAGKAVTAEALLQAAGRAHREGEKRAKALGPDAVWAATAVGNLCWMASKARGWQDGTRTVLDAVVYAGGQSDAKAFDRAKARLAEAREAARGAPAPSAPRSRRPKPAPVGEALAPFLGPVAGAWLARLSAVRDPRRTASPAALTALLRKQGYPAHPSVLAFEERYGGLVMAESPGEEGMDWCFGAFACLKGGGHQAPRGGPGREKRGLVPVAYSPNDNIYFLDASGQAWAHDTIGGPAALPFASDPDHLVARIVLNGLAFALRFRGPVAERDGQRGAALAKKLGLAPIPEASDALGRAWGTAEALVLEWPRYAADGLEPAGWATLAVGQAASRPGGAS